MRVDKNKKEKANHERWLVSYADFITLMFAFFVILYATSKRDTEKFRKMADQLSSAFGGSQSVIEQPPEGAGLDHPKPDLKGMLEESLRFGHASENIQSYHDDRGLVVRLSISDFFIPNSSQIREEFFPVLDRIANVLKKTDKKIKVEGHTDNAAVDSSVNSSVVGNLYPTNWELSTARAAKVVRYFIEKHQFNPVRLEASGLAEYHPIAANDTPSGQAKNRRVEIIVLEKR